MSHLGGRSMLAYPQVNQSLERLSRGGWAMGDLCIDRPDGRVWIVTGQRRKHWIIAQAPSQAAAWWLVWRQADLLEKERNRKKRSSRRSASKAKPSAK